MQNDEMVWFVCDGANIENVFKKTKKNDVFLHF